jgi:DNA-binding MarR family transcriptional regulator
MILPSEGEAGALDRVQQGIERWAHEQPDLDTAATGVVARVLRLASVFQEALARSLAPHGLQPREFSVLAVLRSHGAPTFELAPKALADHTFLTTGGMTSLIDRLQRAGLVDRRPDPSDGRGVLVGLTPEGRSLVDRAVVDVGRAERSLIADLTPSDRDELAAALARLLGAVDTPVRRRLAASRGDA